MTLTNENIKNHAQSKRDSLISLTRSLAFIPSPSGYEDEIALFCKRYLEERGAPTYIDEAKNVIFKIKGEKSDSPSVFMAHTDTVFPDRERMTLTEDDECIFCPGVSDDKGNLAVLMHAALILNDAGIVPAQDIIFVMNSCEEGLGNLKGSRAIMETVGKNAALVVSLDLSYDSIIDRALGSVRYEIKVRTKGGHSFGDFGNESSIHILSLIIASLYEQSICKVADSTTTYNVGVISGGTSVNTIAQDASALYEIRSDSKVCLDVMKRQFFDIIDSFSDRDAKISVTEVGLRPCGEESKNEAERVRLLSLAKSTVSDVVGITPICSVGSTDCNIPLSLGIPSFCMGVTTGGGAHTRAEYLKKDSLTQGLEILLRFIRDSILI